VFELQSIDSGRVCLFDIVVVVVVVEFIDDADTERGGVGKAAKVYSGHVQVIDKAKIALSFQDGIHPHQPFPDKIPMPHVIDGGLPEGVFPIFVFEGDRVGHMVEQVFIGNGQFPFPAVMFEIVAQGVRDGENRFFPGGLIGFLGRSGFQGREGIVTKGHWPVMFFSKIVILTGSRAFSIAFPKEGG
jgi:hypothetical protein